jgi:DNA modification methylase
MAANGVRVQMCVTSPPYWGLRDYGHPGQLGLEPTPQEYVDNMVEVFRLVRDLLADDGTLWLNLGSSYFGASGGNTHAGFNERYFGKPFASDKQAKTAFPVSGGKSANQSRQQKRAPACDSDGTALPDSTGADSACSGLCDGCLADFLTHRERIAGTGQQSEQCAPLLSPTSRDSERLGCEQAIPAASLPSAQESTTLESWRQRRGACSRCDARASSLSMLPPSLLGARESVRSSWLNYTTRFKPKDMIPIPWMVAMALQADGWYLRQDVIWSKPNPMPESVTDRCTKAHEYIFMLSKRERYYFDAGAIAEDCVQDEFRPTFRGGAYCNNATFDNSEGGKSTVVGNVHRKAAGWDTGPVGNGRAPTVEYSEIQSTKRNRRSVWTVATQPYAEAHFATFPPALIEPCILAGSRPGDVVLDPFFGSGTTGEVCERLGRRWIGCELSPEYGKLAAKRTAQQGMMFTQEAAP